MNDKKYRISQLISQHLCGKLSEEEHKELMAWLEENAQNRQLFHQITSGQNFSSKYSIYQHTNWQHAYQRLEKSVNRSYFLRKTLLRYAAIFILPLIVATYFLFTNHPVQSPVLTQVLSPGYSKAVLILSDGKEIPLDSSTIAPTTLPSNIQLNTQKNLLIYQPQQLATTSRNILRTPKGGEYQLTLSDGTLVHLNSASELSFPEVFPTDKREICISGEAWFEVAKDSIRPFYVHTKDLAIRVVGTKFNVNTQIDHKIQTALAEGCIKIKTHTGTEETTLFPNQLAEYDQNTQSFEVTETDILPYISWKDGLFVFSGEKLENILDKLSLWYDFQTSYTDETLKSIRFTGYLKRYDDISFILDAIEKTIRVKFEIKGQTIIVCR